MGLHNKEVGTECGNYHCMSLVAHANKVLLKVKQAAAATPAKRKASCWRSSVGL